jgi:hypothetical protein
MSYVDRRDQMASRRTLKWTRKLFFHLTYLVIVNMLIICRFCGQIMTPKKSEEQLIGDLILL